MKHSIDCPYPEGCNCGASPINRLLRKTTSQEQELATLRAKAEAYDKGQEAWAVFDGDVVLAVGDTKDRAIYKGKKIAGYTNPHCDMWPTMELRGYTCRKVKIVEVVE